MEDSVPTSFEPDFLLDREAGLGWREQGMDIVLRGLLQHREDLLDQIQQIRIEREVPADYWSGFEDTIAEISARKTELGISDPPPLPPEE